MEEKEKTLTLTLPFVDLSGTENDVDATMFETSGIFFVKDRFGAYGTVEVFKDKNEVWQQTLPIGLYEVFFKQEEEQEQADKFKEMRHRFDDLYEYISTDLGGAIDRITKDIRSTKEMMQISHDRLGQLSLCIEDLSTARQSDSDKPKGGYVNEETLLQIIKEVKR